MIVLIQVERGDVDSLLPHLHPDSDLSKRVGVSATNMFPGVLARGSSNQFHCTEGEAYELLRIAREHCSPAVAKIQNSMRLSGVRS